MYYIVAFSIKYVIGLFFCTYSLCICYANPPDVLLFHSYHKYNNRIVCINNQTMFKNIKREKDKTEEIHLSEKERELAESLRVQLCMLIIPQIYHCTQA